MIACKRTVSGSISLPFRGSFRLSLAVLVHYRSPVVLSLTWWSTQIHPGLHETQATRVPLPIRHLSLTGLSPTMALLSRELQLGFGFGC